MNKSTVSGLSSGSKLRRPGGSVPRLRAAAEVLVASASSTTPPVPMERLLHELRVHQIELEMQNDTLLQTQAALEESRDRYVDLYEIAPAGYLTLTKGGKMSEVSLTAAGLLKDERGKLTQGQFLHFIAPKDQDRWQIQLRNAFKHGGKHNCEVSLVLGDGSTFEACLDYLRTGGCPGRC